MKKNMLIVAALVTTLIGGVGFGPSLALANADGGRWSGHHEGRERGHGKRLAVMAEILKLTEEQKAQIAAIHREERQNMAPLREKMRDARKQLRDAAQAQPFDEAKVRTLAASQADIKTELTVSRLRTHNRISAVLTPEQRELAEKIRPLLGGQHRGEHRGEHGAGRF